MIPTIAFLVVPAEAGTQGSTAMWLPLGARFRGHDDRKCVSYAATGYVADPVPSHEAGTDENGDIGRR